MVKTSWYKEWAKQINHVQKNGKMIAMSRETKTKDGFNPSLGIIDEYHEADDSKLLDVIRSGQGSRPEPLLIVITTAGFRKAGPCYSILRKVSIEILDGKKKDDTHFSMIFEPDEDDEWDKIGTWKKVNPNYGVSVFPHYLKSRYLEAKNEGAHKEVDFKTKNLNMWTASASVWIQESIWMQNAEKPHTEDSNTRKWYAGLDMAFKRDYTALTLVSAKPHNDKYDVLCWFWIPEDTVADKTENENINISQWVREGYILTTPGNSTDHRAVRDFVIELNKTYPIEMVVADPAHAISTLNDLNDNGIKTLTLPQTSARLTPAINKMYGLVIEGKMRHGGNPVLNWMVGNCLIKEHSNKLLSILKEDSINRIDGVDALLDALVPFDLEQDKTEFIAELW